MYRWNDGLEACQSDIEQRIATNFRGGRDKYGLGLGLRVAFPGNKRSHNLCHLSFSVVGKTRILLLRDAILMLGSSKTTCTKARSSQSPAHPTRHMHANSWITFLIHCRGCGIPNLLTSSFIAGRHCNETSAA